MNFAKGVKNVFILFFLYKILCVLFFLNKVKFTLIVYFLDIKIKIKITVTIIFFFKSYKKYTIIFL